MRRNLWILTLLAIILLAALPVRQAYAHETRIVTIAGKPTNWRVGWAVEPAYTQVLNNVQLFAVLNGTTTPINGLDTALNVTVSTGGASTTLGLTRSDENPSLYQAAIMPTLPGTYLFTFKGTVNGTVVNQVFDCSRGLFDCVHPLSESQFPVKQPTPTDLSGTINSTNTKVSSLQNQVGTLTTLAAAGIGIGAIGLILAAVALLRRRVPK